MLEYKQRPIIQISTYLQALRQDKAISISSSLVVCLYLLVL
jgi:hypothetical protein